MINKDGKRHSFVELFRILVDCFSQPSNLFVVIFDRKSQNNLLTYLKQIRRKSNKIIIQKHRIYIVIVEMSQRDGFWYCRFCEI